ncbi:alpha-N-acetylgalactosaminide alpha-2,6-sialyltransferase 1 [Nematolebias whitei]|uniref:alpha-N-acetylgalactosaminide alpha-2,6-sialyltransferase 1 n=1 Tax=Nematolebias whitei TaxID=451745 RepID=UPI00189844DF|nr:alpha-N-acetylgalactosaminide alpha-2,6-sialyltransferase 1 [Nematolebias whitei]
MAVQKVRLFSLLLVSSACIILIILFQEDLPGSNKWTSLLRYKSFREDGLIDGDEIRQKEGVLSPSPENSKSYPTSQRNLVTRKTLRKTTPETPIPILSLKSFKKLPKWDFEDIYNRNAPPRPTTCAQSLRNTKDEGFQKAFLPDIRLFLHNDSLTMREWNRLSHFNNPFGFMQMKYDDVIVAVKLIPKPNEPLLLPKPGGDGCVRCAVVGNGGILNGSKMGAEIDAHDYVFRMNGAVIKGYEEDVGRRTSVYVHTAHSINTSPLVFWEYGYKSAPHDEGIKYVLIPEGQRDFQWLRALLKGKVVSSGEYEKKDPRSYYSGQFNESRFYVLHQDFMRYVRNRFLKSSDLDDIYWSIVRPTNGAFTIFLALHTCDSVSAYGFITEDYSKYSNYYVEKTRKTEIVFYANHDFILEKDLWKSFHDKKILKLYQRTEPQGEKTKQR